MSILISLIFPVLLCAAAIHDIMTFKIPNRIIVTLLVAWPLAAIYVGMPLGEVALTLGVGVWRIDVWLFSLCQKFLGRRGCEAHLCLHPLGWGAAGDEFFIGDGHRGGGVGDRLEDLSFLAPPKPGFEPGMAL